jgi:hypothetical protein
MFNHEKATVTTGEKKRERGEGWADGQMGS